MRSLVDKKRLVIGLVLLLLLGCASSVKPSTYNVHEEFLPVGIPIRFIGPAYMTKLHRGSRWANLHFDTTWHGIPGNYHAMFNPDSILYYSDFSADSLWEEEHFDHDSALFYNLLVDKFGLPYGERQLFGNHFINWRIAVSELDTTAIMLQLDRESGTLQYTQILMVIQGTSQRMKSRW